MTGALVLAIGLVIGGYLVLRPWTRSLAWPAEPPDIRDDVARAISSLRDLEFAVAAGTIDLGDAERLRRRIEASAFAPPEARTGHAPVSTFAVAAVAAGLVAVLAVALLPAAAGDRAPGETLTGSVPGGERTLADHEAAVRARPNDVPSRLALADAYLAADRGSEAADQYRAVLAIDPDNVAALNGLGILLFRSGSLDGALLASDRVLARRPRDPDALFLKGLVLYQQQKYAEAVDVWGLYLEVGEYHGAAPMVRSLYDEAKRRIR